MQEILSYIGIAGFILAAVFVIVAVVLFFKLDIRGVQADLSGKARQESIQQRGSQPKARSKSKKTKDEGPVVVRVQSDAPVITPAAAATAPAAMAVPAAVPVAQPAAAAEGATMVAAPAAAAPVPVAAEDATMVAAVAVPEPEEDATVVATPFGYPGEESEMATIVAAAAEAPQSDNVDFQAGQSAAFVGSDIVIEI